MLPVIVTTIIVSSMWITAWILNRRHWKRMERELDKCECMRIQQRAVRMHHAVDTKIRAMDSRSGEIQPPVVETNKETESTDVHKALPPALIVVVLAMFGV